MKFTALILALFSLNALAAIPGYDLKMNVSMNGETAYSGKVQVKEGESEVILTPTKTGERFIDVTSMEDHGEAIQVNVVVGNINEDGSREINKTMKIIVNENSPSTVTKDDVSLSVTAKRTTL